MKNLMTIRGNIEKNDFLQNDSFLNRSYSKFYADSNDKKQFLILIKIFCVICKNSLKIEFLKPIFRKYHLILAKKLIWVNSGIQYFGKFHFFERKFKFSADFPFPRLRDNQTSWILLRTLLLGASPTRLWFINLKLFY